MSRTCSFLSSPHADAQALPGCPGRGDPIAPGYPRADVIVLGFCWLLTRAAPTLQFVERQVWSVTTLSRAQGRSSIDIEQLSFI